MRRRKVGTCYWRNNCLSWRNKIKQQLIAENRQRMPDRKPWETEEDKVLKYLREELQIGKWSTIAKTMAEDYNMPGRTGKQCRERYHNHLDSNILRSEWTLEEEQYMYLLHEEIGNKWAIIAQKLPGRTDNCVKNHFYSKLRKALRKLNKVIHSHFKKDIKEIKTTVLYKIIEAVEEKFKTNPSVDEQVSQRCAKIKKSLLECSNEDEDEEPGPEELKGLAELAIQINDFASKYRRRTKKNRRHSVQCQDLLAIPKFQHKIKSLSDNDSENDSEYSMVFSHENDRDKDSLQVGDRSVRSRSKSQTNLEHIKQEESQLKEVCHFKYEDDQVFEPQVHLQLRVNGRKSFDDKNQIENLLKNQGILELEMEPEVRFFKRDSQRSEGGNSINSEGKRQTQNMFSESFENLKLGELNLDMDIELDDESNLFVSS